jgi:diguanylate cyclase (GGDEF)-like protein
MFRTAVNYCSRFTYASFAVAAALAILWAFVTGSNDLRVESSPAAMAFAVVGEPGSARIAMNGQDLLELPRNKFKHSTELSEAPFVITFDLSEQDRPEAILFPSRHSESIQCFKSAKDWSSSAGSLPLERFKAGYFLRLSAVPVDSRSLVCQIFSVGPAQIQVQSASLATITNEVNRHGRETALLEGSILSLAVFCTLVALVSRERAYFIFGAWMFFNLRLAEITTGADVQFLGVPISNEYFSLMRKIAITGYYLTTVELFALLVQPQVPLIRRRMFSLPLNLACVGMVLILVLPFSQYLPAMWMLTIVGIFSIAAGTGYAIYKKPSKLLLWYSLSWGIAFLGIAFEIAAAALPKMVTVIPLNNVTGAIGAIMLCALCLAERIKQEKAARLDAQVVATRSLEDFQTIYNSVPVALATYNLSGLLTSANPVFEKVFSDPSDRIKFETFLFSKESQEKFAKLGDGNKFGLEEFPLSQSWVDVEAIKRLDALDVLILDVTEKKRTAEKLYAAANRDPLTHLYNRFKMIDLLDQRLVTNVDAATATDCIAMIDIDSFDRVISNFGNGVGDDVLLAYRDRIQEQLPPAATLGRLSADTFLVLMPSTPLNEARSVLQAILISIHKAPFETRSLTVAIKASAGVSVVESKKSKEVLAACDSALQDAKARGGGQLIAYGERDKAWLAHKVERELMAEFSQAIPFERFQIVMQPIVTLLNAKDEIRYEALIRMKDKSGRLLSPESFLTALEKIGLMSQLDRWVVRQVLEFLERESEHFAKLTYASVNLSGASINDERFTDELLRLSAKHPHLVRKVCFEITENIALKDMDATRRFIHRLRVIGARIALDDFGAGYSSFSYLAQLKVDSIKIDGSLVKGIDSDPAKQAIVKTIVDLGKALGSEVVAERVETEKTLALLKRLGVDAGQGWALGKPVPMEIIAAAEHGAFFVTDASIAATLGFSLAEPAIA